MPIEIREAHSKEMKKNMRTVKMMTGGMGFDEKMAKVNWSAVRRISNFGYLFMPREKGVKFYRIKLGDTVSEIAVPKEQKHHAVILYIHGGGFVSGSASASRGYSSMLAKYSGCRVIALNYRLAPEHPFPAGFDDCFDVFCDVTKKYPKAPIILVGESAGGNLSLAVAQKARDMKMNQISTVIVHSPFVDFTNSLDRTEHEIDDFTVKIGCLKPLHEIYAGSADAMNPYISPIYGDYHGFPPTYITCDYNETLFADSMALYQKLGEAGVEAHLLQIKNTFHAFAAMGSRTPETKQILEENVEFFQRYIW